VFALDYHAAALAATAEEVRLMPTCKVCDDEVDALVSVKIGGKTKKMCEDCKDRQREQDEIAEASEGVVQGMMGFKGRR
jgi:hypothetical protein